MARFQGNVNAGPERLAGTLFFFALILLVVLMGLVLWHLNDPAGYNRFWDTLF